MNTSSDNLSYNQMPIISNFKKFLLKLKELLEDRTTALTDSPIKCQNCSQITDSSFKDEHSYSSDESSLEDSYADEFSEDATLRRQVAHAVRETIIDAKSKSEVICNHNLLIPKRLLERVAEDILAMSDVEPCGLRGCLLHVLIEDSSNSNSKSTTSPVKPLQIGNVKFSDHTIVPTFEMCLFLRAQICNSNLKFIFPKTCKDKIMISDLYRLSKKKRWTDA